MLQPVPVSRITHYSVHVSDQQMNKENIFCYISRKWNDLFTIIFPLPLFHIVGFINFIPNLIPFILVMLDLPNMIVFYLGRKKFPVSSQADCFARNANFGWTSCL